MAKSKIIPCKVCGAEIAASAKTCPKCGAKNKKPIYKRWWLWVLVIVMLIAAIGDSGNPTGNSENPTKEANYDTNSSKIVVKAEEKQEDNIPREYKNALKKAKTYSDTMAMSKQGIYEQLTSEYGERFSAETAQYAIDNLEVDYRENALRKAKTYSDTMFMSKQGIYKQLTSEYGERFTAEEAQYAVDNLKVDYKENALRKAKTYSDTMFMSEQSIYEQLTSEYGEQFTAEEAQYAIDNLK